MRWKSLPIVAFDTETTGLEPFGGDRVIEVGLVELHLDQAGRVTKRKDDSFLINPGMPIPPEVSKLTGITDRDVANEPPFAEVAQRVFDVLQGSISIAHNYTFDLAFLSQELKAAGLGWPNPVAEVDTLTLSRRLFPSAKSHRLGDLCKRLGVSLDNAHRATDDAAACGLCFIELFGQGRVEDHLPKLLSWANAIGRPPTDGPFAISHTGDVIFSDGPHEGQPVAHHPLHLAWFDKARVLRDGAWHWRFSEGTRDWARSWLNVRGSGGANPGGKGFHATDWVLDPCIATPRRDRS